MELLFNKIENNKDILGFVIFIIFFYKEERMVLLFVEIRIKD